MLTEDIKKEGSIQYFLQKEDKLLLSIKSYPGLELFLSEMEEVLHDV